MLIDINVCVGHYPFRKLVGGDIDGLIKTMDQHSIDKAIVCSINSLFYRDAHSGNEELFVDTQKHVNRFLPVATVNPKFVGWQHDVDQSLQQWKMRAVMLAPAYHGYRLDDDYGKAALASVAEHDVPLVLYQRFEDRRQRHAWDQAEDLDATSLIEIAKLFPKVPLALINWSAADALRIARAGLKNRLLFDIARFNIVLQKDYQALVKLLGTESIAFGSHLPFDYVGSSLVKLSDIELKYREDWELVKSRNAAKFFDLPIVTP